MAHRTVQQIKDDLATLRDGFPRVRAALRVELSRAKHAAAMEACRLLVEWEDYVDNNQERTADDIMTEACAYANEALKD